MKVVFGLLMLIISQLTQGAPIHRRALVNQSETFYLAAYKPAHSVTTAVDQALSIQIQQFEVAGYQVIVYDTSDGKTIGLSTTIDATKYNITGYVTLDQYIIVIDIENGSKINYLTVDPVTNKLQLSPTPPSTGDKFALSRNQISYNGGYTWSVCASNDTQTFTDSIYYGSLSDNAAYCGTDGRELVLKAIGLVSSDGSIPDYPL